MKNESSSVVPYHRPVGFRPERPSSFESANSGGQQGEQRQIWGGDVEDAGDDERAHQHVCSSEWWSPCCWRGHLFFCAAIKRRQPVRGHHIRIACGHGLLHGCDLCLQSLPLDAEVPGTPTVLQNVGRPRVFGPTVFRRRHCARPLGSQWSGMGAELLAEIKEVFLTVSECRLHRKRFAVVRNGRRTKTGN